MVAVAITVVAMAAMAALIGFTTRSFASLANYSDLNRSSMRTLDYLTRDVRAAMAVSAHTTNAITLDMGAGIPALTYTFSPTSRALIRTEGTNSRVILPDCDTLTFSLYQRTPIPGTYDQYPLATKSVCKVVVAEWTCRRTVLGRFLNTQHSQTAKISMRGA